MLGALAVGGLVAWAQPVAEQGWANRITLGRDVARLVIVVMANQTPISPADAQAVLPALQAIRDADKITEANAGSLNEKLLSAMPDGLRAAVQKVRLPQPRPEVRQIALRRAAEMHIDNPAAHGPGSIAYGKLLQFFSDTAAGKQVE